MRRVRLSGRWMAMAAGLAGVCILGAVWLRYAPTRYETDTGERRLVVLRDGSTVSLDASTRVDVRYLNSRRELWLRKGRAKFAVAKDPRRPFSVAAANKVVVATGTAFTVELLRREVRVVLLEGRVSVLQAATAGRAEAPVRLGARGPGSTAVDADRYLTPGRELAVAIAGSGGGLASVDLARSTAWEGGQLVFADEPLRSAVERVNRYSDRKLSVGDARAAAVLVNGVFDAGKTDDFISGVLAVYPVEIEPDGEGLTFSSRD